MEKSAAITNERKMIMKRILAIMLCLLMLLSFAACGKKPAEAPATETLRVGFGRADITPVDISVPLYGYGNHGSRISTEVLDPIYATCIALTDSADNTILIFTMDLTTSFGAVVPLQRKAISDATGVPFENICLSATHTHSGPAMVAAFDDNFPLMYDYARYMKEQFVQAAVDAMADRAEATIEYGAAYPEGLNFVRHYVMDDGSVIGDNFGTDEGKAYVTHVHKADNQLQVLRFARGDKKDIVLTNFQSHPLLCGGAFDTRITADYIAPMRSYVEAQLDCHFAYFSGASGNIDPASRMSVENAAGDYIDHGIQLGKQTILALSNTTPVSGGKVGALVEDHEVQIKENKSDMTLQALSAGGIGFVAPPYEMFDTNGKYIKENSPFEATFVLYLANSSAGYMAAEDAYRYGGYEVEYTGFVKGTAENTANKFLDMLHTLHGTENVAAEGGAENG